MEPTEFWAVIDDAEGDADAVMDALVALPPARIAEWHRHYHRLHGALHRKELRGAAHLILGGCCEPWEDTYRAGCSDDSFRHFKAWLIGKGLTVYETALRDPDALEPHITERDLEAFCSNEPLNYAAQEAYAQAGGDCDALERDSNESEEPAGERLMEGELPRRFPGWEGGSRRAGEPAASRADGSAIPPDRLPSSRADGMMIRPWG